MFVILKDQQFRLGPWWDSNHFWASTFESQHSAGDWSRVRWEWIDWDDDETTTEAAAAAAWWESNTRRASVYLRRRGEEVDWLSITSKNDTAYSPTRIRRMLTDDAVVIGFAHLERNEEDAESQSISLPSSKPPLSPPQRSRKKLESRSSQGSQQEKY